MDEILVPSGPLKPALSTWRLILLTICLAGIQFTCKPTFHSGSDMRLGTVELAQGTPYLLSLGMPKSLTALVWLAGPLSGKAVSIFQGRECLTLRR